MSEIYKQYECIANPSKNVRSVSYPNSRPSIHLENTTQYSTKDPDQKSKEIHPAIPQSALHQTASVHTGACVPINWITVQERKSPTTSPTPPPRQSVNPKSNSVCVSVLIKQEKWFTTEIALYEWIENELNYAAETSPSRVTREHGMADIPSDELAENKFMRAYKIMFNFWLGRDRNTFVGWIDGKYKF